MIFKKILLPFLFQLVIIPFNFSQEKIGVADFDYLQIKLEKSIQVNSTVKYIKDSIDLELKKMTKALSGIIAFLGPGSRNGRDNIDRKVVDDFIKRHHVRMVCGRDYAPVIKAAMREATFINYSEIKADSLFNDYSDKINKTITAHIVHHIEYFGKRHNYSIIFNKNKFHDIKSENDITDKIWQQISRSDYLELIKSKINNAKAEFFAMIKNYTFDPNKISTEQWEHILTEYSSKPLVPFDNPFKKDWLQSNRPYWNGKSPIKPAY